MNLKKIILFKNSIKYLKFIQIYYRLYYYVRRIFIPPNSNFNEITVLNNIRWKNILLNEKSYIHKNKFNFLNIQHNFKNGIDWNYKSYGKLWTYNLNYFDYLNQKNIDKKNALILINHFISNIKLIQDGLEPYPTSLRIVNFVKFVTRNNINNGLIDGFILFELTRLDKNLEYHLLANHLLENGIALFFGGFYLDNKYLIRKGIKIIKSELDEQILNDGAHFELSPMYHCIILAKILDILYLLKLNDSSFKDFENNLIDKSLKMLNWIYTFSYDDFTYENFNDSTFDIAPNLVDIIKYAAELNIYPKKIKLSNSGYRKINTDFYEFILDIGQIGPDYQPGHAHADTFSFTLRNNSKCLIVDPGISTYNICNQRNLERSTKYHNTVTVGNKDSSEVWSGFRVGNRAKVKIIKDLEKKIIASHDGYKNLGLNHQREFIFDEKKILIKDSLSKKMKSELNIHFHPNCDIKIIKSKNEVQLDNFSISFSRLNKIKEHNYYYSGGYNKLLKARKISVNFDKEIETIIKFN